jgi:hypothetical protein
MAYIKNNWVDREGTTRYFETVDSDGAKIFTPDYTQVTELGTPVNADNMNHIEEGIAAGSFTKFDLNTTYAKDDLVTVIEDSSPVIYKSLVDNNIGNALSSSIAWEKISLGGGGGLEIGDIGFTQIAIDETKGKRRVLNGQLIIQEQYVQFTNIIKNSVALNPDLACTEAEWQTEVTMSTAGICDKYVIDDEAGTIRLPKYPEYFIGGGIAPVIGNGMTLGFTNGTTYAGLSSNEAQYNDILFKDTAYGADVGSTVSGGVGVEGIMGLTTDPTKSGIEAHLNDAELVKGTYFIQVATGAETEDNIINEIELNNPFSLLDYKYSEYELNNISWLKSTGQFNSKAIYPAVYDLLLKIYNGTETKAGVSVKLATETFTDYDFVLNTAEETFRLPIKVKLASGKAVVGNGLGLGLTDGTNNYGIGQSDSSSKQALYGRTGFYGNNVGATGFNTGNYPTLNVPLGITTDPTKSGIETSDSGLYLYFYVGETVQNANLINAGRIEEKLTLKADKTDVDGQWVKKQLVLITKDATTSDMIFDLSSYLPNDGYIYNVLVEAVCYTGTTSGNYITAYISSDLTHGVCISRAMTRTSSSLQAGGNAWIPVGIGRTFTLNGSTETTFKGTRTVVLHGYRRMGTNV